MDYIAKHYHMDLVMASALRLEGRTDREKFKELGWGLRTWDHLSLIPWLAVALSRTHVLHSTENTGLLI
jgi:hypothetical protein